ncbi:MAG: molybdenum cofactor biosysynthesis protein [Rhodoglobus sp.]|nr:molybdenum cofactor biosysynthesis protein [Rhodoglobus sp.]
MYARAVTIELLLASPLHRYYGRPADGPTDATGPELHDSIEVRAGLGIVGDRYFGQRAHRTASVTVMAVESVERIGIGLDPAETRRNIIVRGLDIDAMRGEDFELGGILFRAHRPANPCAWMDVALAPGAFRALRGRGGMRCEPLTSGTLHLGPAVARTVRAPAAVPLF